jgi:uncharacterized glyoxalase superfamily protein PhnB
MLNNRSVPTNTVLPHIVYQNVADAIVWLTRVFGFTEHYRYGDPISGAQLYLGDAWFMIFDVRPDSRPPSQLSFRTQSLTVFVDDVTAHFHRTQSAGAKIVEDLQETIYGELQYGVEDLDGHHWLFSQHARDISPTEWGATVAETPKTL